MVRKSVIARDHFFIPYFESVTVVACVVNFNTSPLSMAVSMYT